MGPDVPAILAEADCGDYDDQPLKCSLVIHVGSEQPRQIRTRDILRCLWTGDLDTSCMICQAPINAATDLLIRTISLAAPGEDPWDSSTSTQSGSFPNIELRIHNYHYECVRNVEKPFIAISHAWHQKVANAYLNGLYSDQEAATHVVNIPFRVLLAATKAYGQDVEIWHDYISIPQWQSTVQQRILVYLPDIFSLAPSALMHLDDVPDDCVHGLELIMKSLGRHVISGGQKTNAKELIDYLKIFFESEWFERMWVCLEYAHSHIVHLLTKDYTVIKSSDSLFLKEIAHARGLIQIETLPDEFSELIQSVSHFRWETWKGLLGFKNDKTCSFGVAMSILAEKKCRTYGDRFTAINVLLGLDLGDSLLDLTPAEACKLAAWKSLSKSDYTPLLLAPCGESETMSVSWLRGHEHMRPEIWTLRGERRPATNSGIIRDNHIMPLLEPIGILTEWQYQSFEDFETVVRKVVQNTAANPEEFTNTIARLYIDQDHDLSLSPGGIALQNGKYKPDGSYMSTLDTKDMDQLEEILSTIPFAGDSSIFKELMKLIGLDKPAVIGADSRLRFGAKVAPKYHGKDKDALASVCCKICQKVSSFRIGIWTDPGQCAQIYRIPGLWLERSLPNGVGLVISAGRIVGRLVYGTPACGCHELEEVLIV